MRSTIKKVVIASGNESAANFFDELKKRKDELRKKIENLPSIKAMMGR